jgi:hypothetical protein
MCTLPGCTYHAVRNTRKNFTVAIYYKTEGTPEEPLRYKCVSLAPLLTQYAMNAVLM